MINVMDEYLLYTEKAFYNYMKLIFGDKYEKKLVAPFIETYFNVRYSNYLDEESNTLTLSKKINKALDETMRNLINENKKDKELIIVSLKRFSTYFYNLDQLYFLDSQKKAIEKIKEDRLKLLKIEDDGSFVSEFMSLLNNDIKKKKEYLENFGSNIFYSDYKKISKNEFYVSLKNKIVFPEIYSETAIEKVGSKDIIGEDLTVINFLQIGSTIVNDLINCNFEKVYYVYLPDTFFDKKVKLSRVLKIVDNGFVQDKLRIIITFKCFKRYKSYIKECMRNGFVFSIYLDETFEYSSENTEFIELFEKIFIESDKYYFKDMKKSVKIKDRIVSIDEVK